MYLLCCILAVYMFCLVYSNENKKEVKYFVRMSFNNSFRATCYMGYVTVARNKAQNKKIVFGVLFNVLNRHF